MIKNLINRIQYRVLIQVFFLGISILLSTYNCYADMHRKRNRHVRYGLSFGINFSNIASQHLYMQN